MLLVAGKQGTALATIHFSDKRVLVHEATKTKAETFYVQLHLILSIYKL
jgi:hypothetical protein